MSIGKLILIGNDPKCGRCHTFQPTWESEKLKAFASANGAEMIDANQTKAPAVWKKWLNSLCPAGIKVDYPDLYVLDKKGKTLGHFSMIKGPVDNVIKKIKTLCPECCESGTCSTDGTSNGDTTGTLIICPACKGKKVCKCSQCGLTGKCWKCKGKGKVTV